MPPKGSGLLPKPQCNWINAHVKDEYLGLAAKEETTQKDLAALRDTHYLVFCEAFNITEDNKDKCYKDVSVFGV